MVHLLKQAIQGLTPLCCMQGPPLKYSFLLDALAASYGIDNSIIPAAHAPGPAWEEPTYTPYYSPQPYEATMSPVAAAFAEGAAEGKNLAFVGYDGYLDQCSVRPACLVPLLLLLLLPLLCRLASIQACLEQTAHCLHRLSCIGCL